jgi:dsDNA-specific endonuclease/ATPase MutS2
VHAEIVHIDRFGNLVTNVTRADLEALGSAAGVNVVLAGILIQGLKDHYAQAEAGELMALFGSEGLLEVAVARGSAAEVTGAAIGLELSVTQGEVAVLPLDGELDLHTFKPSEVADVVEEYVRACHEGGIRQLRIVHGKGRGTLRRTVHAVLARLAVVEGYRLAPAERGGWGATLVDLADIDPR